MSTTSLERPIFFEGQYLGADDLTALVDYLRAQLARHDLGHHTWGILMGLDLVSQELEADSVEVYVQPGVAVDGYGRVILVSEPIRIEAAALLGTDSGEVPVWIRFQETAREGVRKGFEVCSASDEYARAAESFVIEVGERASVLERQGGVLVNGLTVPDAREALNAVDPDAPLVCDGSIPHQALPVDAQEGLWLVPLGLVHWSGASASLQALSDEQRVRGRTRRRYAGVVGEQLFAADGLIRLRGRTEALDPAQSSDALCEAHAPRSSDLMVCDEQLLARESIWLEGHTRLTGDLRLFDATLEFRDGDGRDYLTRVVDGIAIPAISPLALRRRDGNSKGGSDLQLLLGGDENTRNRLVIGSARITGTGPCDQTLELAPDSAQVIVQDNGRVGIGTAGPDPDTNLDAPLTIRGLVNEITENPGTADEQTYEVRRVLTVEDEGGNPRWQLDLWRDAQSLSLNESGVGNARLYLRAGGNLGVGNPEPEARLEVSRCPIRNNSPLGDDLWLRLGEGGDNGRVWVEYGAQEAPLLVLSDRDDPPRIQFQQTASEDPADDAAPAHWSWIGHARDESPNLAVIGGDLGVGTQDPDAPLCVQGDGGNLRLYSGANGGHVWTGFYNDGGPGSVRSGWIGYLNDGYRHFTILNEVAGGDILLRPDRFVGVGTTAPSAMLDVHGDIRLGPNGDFHALAGDAALRLVAGQVNADGSLAHGVGFQSSRLSLGRYRIDFDTHFTDPPVVVATAFAHTDNLIVVASTDTDHCIIESHDYEPPTTGMQNIGFTFIATGPR